MFRRGSRVVRRLLASVVILTLMSSTPILATGVSAQSAYSAGADYGQCTWYALQMRPDLAGRVWGNASNWTYAASASGEATGSVPLANAVAVFQPGAQGAWGPGHVAYVTDVGQHGWFRVTEMDFPNAGRISARWAQTGSGVSFVY